jgi:hypothetical protein
VAELNTYRVPDLYGARNAADLLLHLGIVPDATASELRTLSDEITAELETR